jgi:hypothetical protein
MIDLSLFVKPYPTWTVVPGFLFLTFFTAGYVKIKNQLKNG